MTMQFKVDASELNEFGADVIEAAQDFKRIVKRHFRMLGEHARFLCRVELMDVRYTGELSDSFVVEVNEGMMTVKIFPTAKHAIYVRMGTRPHWAPIGPLKRWAAVKLGDERLAYPVQRSIARFGTSMQRHKLTGSKDNPWPKRVVRRSDFVQEMQRAIQAIGTDIVARVIE